MIDTIALVLTEGMFTIVDGSKFTPSAKTLLEAQSYRPFTCKQNPLSSELKAGIYKPRLTLTRRPLQDGRHILALKIELSLPKLIFGNNFDELQNSDYESVTQKLRQTTVTMGVLTLSHNLDKAPVSAIHYSKNISLTDGTTPHYLISKIKEANITLALDVNQTDYRNDGRSFKWHCNSYEVAFYDKIKDLETSKKSEKRAIENDNSIQLGLFDTLQSRKYLEVLRMEVRLNKREKIRQLFSSLGIASSLTFHDLFSKDISQKVLLHYLDQLESKRLPLFDHQPTSPKSLFAELVIRNPKITPRKILQIFGLKIALDSISPRELKAMFGKYSKRGWYRLLKEAKDINLPAVKSPLLVIRKHLTEFEPLKLVDFQKRLINNDK